MPLQTILEGRVAESYRLFIIFAFSEERPKKMSFLTTDFFNKAVYTNSI